MNTTSAPLPRGRSTTGQACERAPCSVRVASTLKSGNVSNGSGSSRRYSLSRPVAACGSFTAANDTSSPACLRSAAPGDGLTLSVCPFPACAGGVPDRACTSVDAIPQLLHQRRRTRDAKKTLSLHVCGEQRADASGIAAPVLDGGRGLAFAHKPAHTAGTHALLRGTAAQSPRWPARAP